LLEGLCAQIFFFRFVNIGFSWHFFFSFLSVWKPNYLKPVSPLNRDTKGKMGHFKTFEVWTFVPAIFWFLVVCVVKMWSARGAPLAIRQSYTDLCPIYIFKPTFFKKKNFNFFFFHVFFQFLSRFLLPISFSCFRLSISLPNSRENQVEPLSKLLAQPDFSGKRWKLKLIAVRVDSGWLRVAGGGCGDKAPPLAARPTKVAEKISGTKISQYYLRRHLHRVIKCRRHLCPKSPETFERKLRLFWLKEPLIKI